MTRQESQQPWSRPPLAGTDAANAGPGTPPPGRTAEEADKLRATTRAVMEQVQDVQDLLADVLHALADAHSARAGALAQISVAANTLRSSAGQLEALLTHPTAGTQDGPEATEEAGR